MDFQMNEKNSVIFQGEKIIIADCTARSTADVSRLNSVISKVILLTVTVAEKIMNTLNK